MEAYQYPRPFPRGSQFINLFLLWGQNIIFESSQEPAQHHLKTGTLITDGQSYLKVAVDGGFLVIHQLQIAGKKRMMVADFLRGWKNKGDAFVH